MTETVATEAVVTEVTAPTFYTSIEQADPVTAATIPVVNTLATAANAIITSNGSKSKGVDEIAADLAKSSTDAKVVALREKRDEINEQISKAVLAEAKALKDQGGDPDVEAEKNALTAYNGVLKALKTFPDYARVTPFLTDVLPSNVGRVGSTASSTGPKNDLSAVRVWARSNGYPDVKDKGRMSDEILDAYSKANGK